jgi:hypothetical protein
MGVIPSALVEAGHTTNKDLDEKVCFYEQC